MRNQIEHFSEMLELVYLEPLRFADEINTNPISPKIVSLLSLFIASFSLSVGFVFISPPYGSGFYGQIVLNTILHMFLLSLFPIIFGAIFDSYTQKLERKGKTREMILYSALSLGSLSLFTPIAVLMTFAGITGVAGFFLTLVLVVGFYFILLTRGGKYIYELKQRDAIFFTLKSFGIAIFFPMALYFYLTANFIFTIGSGL